MAFRFFFYNIVFSTSFNKAVEKIRHFSSKVGRRSTKDQLTVFVPLPTTIVFDSEEAKQVYSHCDSYIALF